MNEKDFYLNAALYAMQGMQESGSKLSDVAELFPKAVAKHAFDFADAMLEEAKNRGMFAPMDGNMLNESENAIVEGEFPTPLTREEIASILRGMKPDGTPKDTARYFSVRYFSCSIINPDYDPSGFSQDIENAEPIDALIHSHKWLLNHKKGQRILFVPTCVGSAPIFHADGTIDYCSDEVIDKIMSVGKVVDVETSNEVLVFEK